MAVEPIVAKKWEVVLESLRAQLPSSTYRTWVLAAEPLACEDGVLTIGVVNSYAREKLLALPEIQTAAKHVLGRDARVDVFTLGAAQPGSTTAAISEASPHETGGPAAAEGDLSIEPRYLSRYEEIVRPERVVSIPRYYLRWIPYLGVDLAWIPIAFRQVAYFRGLGFEAGDEFQCSHRELALWAGMSERNLYRKINDPRLGWFIQRADQEVAWSVGKDGAPHREALSWVVMMSMPLTPADQLSLERFLRQAVASGLSQRSALQAAYDAPLEQLLPPPDAPDVPETASPARGVEQVVERALGKDVHLPEMRKLLAALSIKIGGYGESIEITHYFIRQHLPLPTIGGGRGWLVQVLRVLSQQQGHPTDTVVSGGHGRLGTLLGVSTATVRRWMSETRSAGEGALGLESFVRYKGLVKYADGRTDLVVQVARDEPLLPEHSRAGSTARSGVRGEAGAALPDGASPDEHPVSIGTDPSALPDSIRADPSALPDSIRADPAAQVVSHAGGPDAQAVSIGPRAGAQVVSKREPIQARRLSALKGGGGSLDSDSDEIETNTLFDAVRVDDGAHAVTNVADRRWDLGRLLRLASVHPATRARLQGASPVAWVSWLLYWASPLGERLLEPTGNAISRLKEAPLAPMAGAFERLAGLGPDGLEEMIVPRVLSRYGDLRSCQDWDDVMRGAPQERLRRLVDLLGFDLAAWEEVELEGEPPAA